MAAAAALQFVLCFCLLFLVSPASPLYFRFSNFTDIQSTQNISLHGGAKQSDGLIVLTDGTKQNDVGRALFRDQLRLWDGTSGNLISFTTRFSFNVSKINGTAPNGDGLAFFLAPYPAQDIPTQSDGSNLALFNNSANRVMAVEFDSFHNNFDPFPEAPCNHIGIDVYSIKSIAFASLGTFNISDGLVADASVIYNAKTMNMSARLSYAAVSGAEWEVWSLIDLRNYLPEDVAIGFSASTGGHVESHAIISWDFNSTELDLPTTNNGSSHKSRQPSPFIISISVILPSLGLVGFGLWCLRRWRQQGRQMRNMVVGLLPNADGVLDEPRCFSYEQLARATNYFAEEGKLGEGGFGTVHMATLSLPVEAAIKKFSSRSSQGERQYLAEIEVFSRLRHPNLVRLIGHCRQDQDFLLVYQYMPNLSLDRHLYDNHRFLDWPTRHRIVVGLASALLYLHENREHYVLHRDIKPSNVMLDREFNAKLGDFGLAKLVNNDRDAATTTLNPLGSFGYVAPEYIETGQPRRESDVFSFGVTVLEIACGRRPMAVRWNLVDWVWGLYEAGVCLAAADHRLNGEFDEKQMKRLMAVGLWCANRDYTRRPSIRRALDVLNNDAPLPTLPPCPQIYCCCHAPAEAGYF